MLSYAYGHEDRRTNEIVARFVAQLIPHVDRGFPAGYQSIGVIDAQGRLIAGVIYYHHNKRSGTIELALAALPRSRWLTRETLRRIFGFAFEHCNCQMLIVRVRADDEQTLGLLARFGFAFVKMPRLYGRESDGVMCALTDDEWATHPAVARNEMREAA